MTVAAQTSVANLATAPVFAVQAQSLCKSLDERPVLRDIGLEIASGDFVALLGANGAGKSTLLRILATLLPADSGSVRIFGESISDNPVSIRARIGLIGHQSMLYRELSARENLELFGGLYGVHDVAGRADELLEMVNLAGRADDPVKAFSRGMLQRVAIARALMHDPQLILADEPFSGLDNPSALAMQKMLTALHSGGRTIILVNHDIPQSLDLARRVVVLRGGCVALDVAAAQITPQSVLKEVCQ